jgi:hypothetical protein
MSVRESATGRATVLFDLLGSVADVQGLIDGGEREGETLEYKTASHAHGPTDHGKVAVDVSAFANSAGGLIIYGVATDKNDRTRPVAIEPLRSQNIDLILQAIATRIRHPIRGIRTKVLSGDGGEPVCLLVDVPASDLAPHQVAVEEYRYYRRNGPHNQPMSHDLLELYFGRRLGPLLTPRLIMTLPSPGVERNGMIGNYQMDISLLNVGQRSGKNALVLAYLFEPAFELVGRPSGPGFVSGRDGRFVKLGANLGDEVFHPGLEGNAYWFHFRLDPELATRHAALLSVSVYADDMATQSAYGSVEPVRGDFGLRTLTEEEFDAHKVLVSGEK